MEREWLVLVATCCCVLVFGCDANVEGVALENSSSAAEYATPFLDELARHVTIGQGGYCVLREEDILELCPAFLKPSNYKVPAGDGFIDNMNLAINEVNKTLSTDWNRLHPASNSWEYWILEKRGPKVIFSITGERKTTYMGILAQLGEIRTSKCAPPLNGRRSFAELPEGVRTELLALAHGYEVYLRLNYETKRAINSKCPKLYKKSSLPTCLVEVEG